MQLKYASMSLWVVNSKTNQKVTDKRKHETISAFPTFHVYKPGICDLLFDKCMDFIETLGHCLRRNRHTVSAETKTAKLWNASLLSAEGYTQMHYQTRICKSIVRHSGPAKNVYTHIQNLTAKMYTLQQILTIDIFDNGWSYDRKVTYDVFSKDKGTSF